MNADKRQPEYQRVAEDLRASVRRGVLGAGDALPSEPTMAAAYGVNRATVRRALAQLREEGLIETHPKAGSTVAAVVPDVQVPAPAEVAELLEVPPGQLVTRRVRTALREGLIIPTSVTYLRPGAA